MEKIKQMTDDYVSEKAFRDLTNPRNVVYGKDLESGLKEPEFENLEIPECFGPVNILIDEYKVKRYAFVIDDYSSWSFSHGEHLGQAGLLVNDLLQLFTLAYKGSHVIGLHTEEQIWFENPVRVGEIVKLEGTYTDKFINRNHGHVVMEAIARGEDGRTIVRHRGVEIMKVMPGYVAGRGNAKPSFRVQGEVPESARFLDCLVEDIKVGDALVPIVKEITAEQAAVYSRVGEFVTNIHNNLDTARKGGLRIPIVQGAQLFCLMAEHMSHFFGKSFFTNGWMKTKFIAPVEVCEAVEVSGYITAIDHMAEGKVKVSLEIWIRRRSDNCLAVIGWVSCIK